MSRKILCILSEWGFWGEELVGPLDAFDKQGYEVVFATGTGKRPVPLPPSEDPTFVDPPLGPTVTSEEKHTGHPPGGGGAGGREKAVVLWGVAAGKAVP